MELNVSPGTVAPSPGSDAYIFISKVDDFPPHIHQTCELLLMLSGEMQVDLPYGSYTLKEDDLLLINARTVHDYRPSASGSECTHVVCQIDLSSLQGAFDLPNAEFYLNSAANPDSEHYQHLRALIARLVEAQSSDDQNLLSRGLLYEILSELTLNFSQSKPKKASRTDSKYRERRDSLIQYISDHYRENLTLNLLADTFHLSVPYLSAFFKNEIGMTFTEYYNILRLDHAVNDMLSLEDPIDTIAHGNGFSDTRTFVRLFREKYGMIPSLYRKTAKENNAFPAAISRHGNLFFPSVPKSDYLPKLNGYLQSYLPEQPEVAAGNKEARLITCTPLIMTQPAKGEIKEFQKTCFLQDYHELLQTSMQALLADLQEEIHFDYISFDIFSYLNEFADKQEIVAGSGEFYFIDQVLDYLISVRLSPMFTFRLDYEDKPDEEPDEILSLKIPENIPLLMQAFATFLQHIISRYGISAVREWRFRIWFTRLREDNVIDNLPSLLAFYEQAYRTVKAASDSLCMCSYAIGFGFPGGEEANRDFAAYCKTHDCFPDCFYFTYSARQYQERDGKVFVNPAPEDWVDEIHDRIRAYQEKWGIEEIPSYLFEYNSQTSLNNPINDTCYKSCYVTHNIVSNLNRSNMTGFWQLSDNSSGSAGALLFHGETSLYTYNGIAKPFFHVFSFINRLGNEIHALENGYIVTHDAESKKIILLFYNYDFYQDAARKGTAGQGRSAFQNMNPVRYSIKIDQIDGDFYIMKQYCVSPSHGSSYDAWVKLGCPQYLSESSMNFIRNVEPDLSAESGKINNGIINIEAELEPLEIRLIELEIFSSQE